MATGIEQLTTLDGLVACRRAIAARYAKAFWESVLSAPCEPPGCLQTYQTWRGLLEGGIDRDEGIARQREAGITARRGIMRIDRERPYENLRGRFPGAEHAAARTLRLPLYDALRESDPAQVIAAVRSAIA